MQETEYIKIILENVKYFELTSLTRSLGVCFCVYEMLLREIID